MSDRRDACPSVHAPFEAIDGALVRVRVPGGVLSTDTARAIAHAASLSRDGIIEITNRANLQLRGVGPDRLDEVRRLLVNGGAAFTDGAADARRNVMASPLAGLDPSELIDVTGLAADIARILAFEAAATLAPKFGVIIDGGGRVHLRGRRHDLALGAVIVEPGSTDPAGGDRMGIERSTPAGAPVRFEVAFGGALPRRRSLGVDTQSTDPHVLVVDEQAVPALVRAVVRLCGRGERAADIVRKLGLAGALRCLQDEVGNGAELVDERSIRSTQAASASPIGTGAGSSSGRTWLGAAPVLGRITATQLRTLADLADAQPADAQPADAQLNEAQLNDAQPGVTDGHDDRPRSIRLTPWRSIVVTGIADGAVDATRDALEAIGLSTDPSDPGLHVVACAGSTGCASAAADTQADARILVDRLRRHRPVTPPISLHLSGCAKGCATRGRTDVTLVAGPQRNRYDVYLNGSIASPGRILGRGLTAMAGGGIAITALGSVAPASGPTPSRISNIAERKQ